MNIELTHCYYTYTELYKLHELIKTYIQQHLYKFTYKIILSTHIYKHASHNWHQIILIFKYSQLVTVITKWTDTQAYISTFAAANVSNPTTTNKKDTSSNLV